MGYDYEAEAISSREAFLRDFIRAAGVGKSEGVIKAPMPGLIVKTDVEIGDTVKKNQGVIVMEAMKMENEIKAPMDGTIKSLNVKAGDAVEKNQVLAEIVDKEATDQVRHNS
ncbi:biotin/lipoyl-binding protein [bacterium]|nr:biotin/lipoyl-binding protein [bacterium]